MAAETFRDKIDARMWLRFTAEWILWVQTERETHTALPGTEASMARTIKSATVASDSTGWSYWVHFTDGHGESGEAESCADGILLASVYGAPDDISDWSEERDGALRWVATDTDTDADATDTDTDDDDSADADADDSADGADYEMLETMLRVAELADDDEGADLARRAMEGDEDAIKECVRVAELADDSADDSADADDDYELTTEMLELMLEEANLADDDAGADLVKAALAGDEDATAECFRSALENAQIWSCVHRTADGRTTVQRGGRTWVPASWASAQIERAQEPLKMAVWLCQMEPEQGTWE